MQLRMFEVMQDVDHISLKDMESALSHKTIKRWAYILHDKDTKEDGTLKNPHYHIICDLGKNPYEVESIAKWFNIEPQYVSKIKTTIDDAFAYLVHNNDDSKYSYSPSYVMSNFNYTEFLNVYNHNRNLVINNPYLSYSNGRKVLSEQFYKDVYSNNLSPCDIQHCFDFRTICELGTQLEKVWEGVKYIKRPERSLWCIYVYGMSGTGKSTWAYNFCKDRNYSYYRCSQGSTGLDNYMGEKVIIFDDIRDSDYPFHDLLKITDPLYNCRVHARYHDVDLSPCHVMIFTSTLPLSAWYRFVDEDKVQLYRRIKTIYNINTSQLWEFDLTKRKYVLL